MTGPQDCKYTLYGEFLDSNDFLQGFYRLYRALVYNSLCDDYWLIFFGYYHPGDFNQYIQFVIKYDNKGDYI